MSSTTQRVQQAFWFSLATWRPSHASTIVHRYLAEDHCTPASLLGTVNGCTEEGLNPWWRLPLAAWRCVVSTSRLLLTSNYRKNLLKARVHGLCCCARSSTVLDVRRNPRWTTGLSHCYPTIPERVEMKKKEEKRGKTMLRADFLRTTFIAAAWAKASLVSWAATSGESASPDVSQRWRRWKKKLLLVPPRQFSFSLENSLLDYSSRSLLDPRSIYESRVI